MRSQFIDSILSLRYQSNRIFLLVADLGFSVIEPFVNQYPDSFLNVGVAEQNMAGIAAGLASEGFFPFCYSIANFNTFRCAEHIRNDIDYHNLPVCTVSVGGGVAYGNMGYSHHAVQDYALMRTLPNHLICAPSDPKECSLLLNLIYSRNAPAYLRLHKQGEPVISKDTSPIVPGCPRFYGGNSNSSIAVLSTGFATQGIYKRYSKSDYALYSLPAWGMSCRTPILDWVKNFQVIYVVEDHLLDGGFTSWILECLVGTPDISKIRFSCLSNSTIGYVASEDLIHSKAGIYDLNLPS